MNGQLEVSRSFGDVELRSFGVISEPDLRVSFRLTAADEFLLLACDGLWTRHTPQSAVDFIRSRIAAMDAHRASGCARRDCVLEEVRRRSCWCAATARLRPLRHRAALSAPCVQHNWDLQAVVKGLIDDAVLERGVKDNVTALLIRVVHTR